MARMEIWPVLIAGGSGTRFWPLSRKSRPKQLLCLLSEKPLICRACEVIRPLAGCGRIFISTSQSLAPALRKALPGINPDNFVIEPEPGDTAPAIGLALAIISRGLDPAKPEPVLAFLPADSFIAKPAQFRSALRKAAAAAYKRDLIVTIGVRPRCASASLGYILPGEPLKTVKGAFRVKRFAEKPGASTAAKYLKQGYLWNAGIFLARPSVLRAAFQKYQPAMSRPLEAIRGAPPAKLKTVIAREFPRLEKTSFDYAVMERAREAAVVPGEFGWSDLGSYHALAALSGRAGMKNRGKGRLVSVDSGGLFVHSEKLVAAVGVRNLAIVDTGDAILVMGLDQDARLKELVAQMARKGLNKYL